MIRICYLNRPGLGVITQKGLGGAQLLSFTEASELAKDQRFDVHMLVEGNDYRRLRQKGVTIWVIPRAGPIIDFFRTCRVFKKINADYYLERVLTKTQRLYDPFWCRIIGKKFVYAEATDPDFLRKFTTINQLAYKTLLFLSNIIVANSRTIQEHLRHWTTRTVHNIPVPAIPTRAQPRKRGHILWVARADKYKRPEIFVKLARSFPKEKFLMVVAGILHFPLAPNITVIHDVPNNKIDSYYASAKMLVQTSITEGFGIVYLEAWRNKTPVVSLSVNPDGVLTGKHAGLLSGTFEQMVKDVQRLLTDKKLCKKLAENGYAYTKNSHDIKLITEQYKKLLLRDFTPYFE